MKISLETKLLYLAAALGLCLLAVSVTVRVETWGATPAGGAPSLVDAGGRPAPPRRDVAVFVNANHSHSHAHPRYGHFH